MSNGDEVEEAGPRRLLDEVHHLRVALVRLSRFTEAMMSSSPRGNERLSFADLRYSDSVLRRQAPGEYGDENDPWPDDTAQRVAALAELAAPDESPLRAMYQRLAAEYELEPTVPDHGGGVKGDRYP